MTRKRWNLLLPLTLFVCGGGWILLNPTVIRGANDRIANSQFYDLEKKLGYHLYAPTWLPYGGRVGTRGALQGKFRVLQDFTDQNDRALVIVAQEKRNASRDKYHLRRFVQEADAKADVNGKPAYFVTGTSGERRLFWYEQDAALIVSSSLLSDPELLAVAEKLR